MSYAPNSELANAAKKLRSRFKNASKNLCDKLDELGVDSDIFENFKNFTAMGVVEGHEVGAFKVLSAFVDQITNLFECCSSEGLAAMQSLIAIQPTWMKFKNAVYVSRNKYYNSEQA